MFLFNKRLKKADNSCKTCSTKVSFIQTVDEDKLKSLCVCHVVQVQSRFSFRRFSDDDADDSVDVGTAGDERSTFDVVRLNPLAASLDNHDDHSDGDGHEDQLQPYFQTDQHRLI